MIPTDPQNVTELLLAWSKGDETALEQLVPLVEAELRRIARRHIARERHGHALQTTELINEAYLRLINWKNAEWESRAHFFGVAAQLMRRVLVDQAREQNCLKRGADMIRVSLAEVERGQKMPAASLLALDLALQSLTGIDPRKSMIIELRYFGGRSNDEIASILRLSKRTVIREWGLAQAWLYRELFGSNANES